MIPKRVRDQLGLRPGDKVRLEVLDGKKVVLQVAVSAPEDAFIKAGRSMVDEVLGDAKKADESKIRDMLRSLGVDD